MEKPKVLIVDDHDNIRSIIRYVLEKEGYLIVESSDGDEALFKFETFKPDLVVLDVVMPKLNGLEVCKNIRLKSLTPILFLSSKDDEIDRILGLEAGGDDYIAKPFNTHELLLRCKVILKRTHSPSSIASNDKVITNKSYSLNCETYTLEFKSLSIPLTATEFAIMKALMSTPKKIFTREDLLEIAYKDISVTDRTIDTHIKRIRKKCLPSGFDPLETVHGIGYKLV